MVVCCIQNDVTQDLFTFLAMGWQPCFSQLLLYLLTLSVPVGDVNINQGPTTTHNKSGFSISAINKYTAGG